MVSSYALSDIYGDSFFRKMSATALDCTASSRDVAVLANVFAGVHLVCQVPSVLIHYFSV